MPIVDKGNHPYTAVAIKRGGLQSSQAMSKPIYDVLILDHKHRVSASYTAYTTRSLLDMTKYTVADRDLNKQEIKRAINARYGRVLFRTKALANGLIADIATALGNIITKLTHMMITDSQVSTDMIMLDEYVRQLKSINKHLVNVFDQPFYNIKYNQLHSVENKINAIVNRLRNHNVDTGQGVVPLIDQSLVDIANDKIRMYNNFTG